MYSVMSRLSLGAFGSGYVCPCFLIMCSGSGLLYVLKLSPGSCVFKVVFITIAPGEEC